MIQVYGTVKLEIQTIKHARVAQNCMKYNLINAITKLMQQTFNIHLALQ